MGILTDILSEKKAQKRELTKQLDLLNKQIGQLEAEKKVDEPTVKKTTAVRRKVSKK